jgi:hypothetical protein
MFKSMPLKQFPVDLDDVWPLAYAFKQHAVRSLKNDFIQNIDYKALTQYGERGAASPIKYFISTSCLEYFIARKIDS